MRSRLWFRLYLGAVLALAALFAFAIVYSRFTFSERRAETELWAQRLFADLARHRHEPAELAQAVDWVRGLKSLSVSLYDGEGKLIASSSQAPEPLDADTRQKVLAEGTQPVGWSSTALKVPLGETETGIGVVQFGAGQGSQLLLFIAGDLLLMLLLALALNRHLVRPLRRIADAATRFGRGELTARSGVKRSDEIGDVARAFDETADRVNRLMAAQRELIANVSHELRTPLARMQVAIDLIADGMAQQSVELLPELTQDLKELERLLDDVMTLARLELAESNDGKALTPLRKEPTLPQDLVARAADRFRAQHPERQLAVHVEEPLDSLDVDPVLMRRVLDNLIDNARKYSEPNTAIDVDVARKAGRVALTVRDRGIGIEHKDLEHIFTPFFRTDRSRDRATGGVGLGLVLARRVVEAHGGTIQIESEVGKGTAVRFELPAS